MTIQTLDFAAPFFAVDFVTDESRLAIEGRAIFLNLGSTPVSLEAQQLAPLQSAILSNVEVHDIERAVLITGFESHDSDEALFAAVRGLWPSAFEKRGEERLRGVEHYMSPKVVLANIDRLDAKVWHILQ